MANKAQAKAAIDLAATHTKADIDTILPVGVVIRDGELRFGPEEDLLLLDAGGVKATADSWQAAIEANLTAASRLFTVSGTRGRRGNDPPFAEARTIDTKETNGPLRIRITNF